MSYVYDALHPYQKTGAHFMRRAGNALLTDQPGLGKTIQTLGSIIATASVEDRVFAPATRWHLVVTPKVAISNVWVPEIARWLRDFKTETLALTGTLAERQAALVGFVPKVDTEHVFVVVNIESMRIKPVDDFLPRSRRDVLRFTKNFKGEKIKMVYAPENGVLPGLLDRTWDTVVCDESQRALIRTSGVPTQVRAGFVLCKSRRRLALSGTPMRGKPEQLWGTLNWLRPNDYRSYWNWVKYYFEITSDGYSNFIIGGLTASGKSRLAADLAGIMLRRTKEEVLPDLPPKTYAGHPVIEGDDSSPLGIWLPMTAKQKKQYDRIVIDGLIGDAIIDNALTDYTRKRQVAGSYCEVVPNGEKVTLVPLVEVSPKFEWVKEWLEENDGEKVVIVSQYTSVLKAYAGSLTGLGYEVVAITGAVSDAKRKVAVDSFQNGSAQIMLLNVAAGGVALTLDAADYLVFLDETSIPDDQEQAEDRIHRASRMHNVTIYYLRTLDTIEEEVAYIAAARQDVQRYLLDGARGVEYARSVYLTARTATTTGSES